MKRMYISQMCWVGVVSDSINMYLCTRLFIYFFKLCFISHSLQFCCSLSFFYVFIPVHRCFLARVDWIMMTSNDFFVATLNACHY